MFKRLMVANRGEIAVRIMRTAAGLGITTVAVYSKDDADSLHTVRADQAIALDGEGAPPYLDINTLVAKAVAAGCDAIHPGYGFLSENADFARACAENGVAFIGPSPETLSRFGDKGAARQLAIDTGIPVLAGTTGDTTVESAKAFMASLAPGHHMMIKAISGGGGRGVRIVSSPDEVADAFERCSHEAQTAFGNSALYVEEFMPRARHIEVQVLADKAGNTIHLGERDCSLQRRHQKIIEIAPAPALDDGLRTRIHEAAVTLAKAARYEGAGTIEFLVDTTANSFAFIEANARLQVEHTITEEIMGVDLVEAQLKIAAGTPLNEIVSETLTPKGTAIQLRINMETMLKNGFAKPSGGTLSIFSPPSGPDVRVDSYAYSGYRTNPRFDSLLAKLIVHNRHSGYEGAIASAYRALCECQIEGFPTNLGFLQNLLVNSDVRSANFHTRFIDDNVKQLVQEQAHPKHYVVKQKESAAPRRAGASVDAMDPLAVLSYGQQERVKSAETQQFDNSWVLSPMQGTIIEIGVQEGDEVPAGATLLVMDSMKMEHEVFASISGVIQRINVAAGDTIYEKQPLISIEAREIDAASTGETELVDLDAIRPDLDEIVTRRGRTLDEQRPAAVERRHSKGQRTARENILDLCDEDSFVEYGQLVLAAQRRRRSIEELIEKSPADGMITGVGAINGDLFDDPDNRCVVMSYDYTVFAGTQGGQNHRKTDRMIGVAEDGLMPMVLFAEGGGGRPGDTDGTGGGGTTTFARFAQLSGLVPMVGITSGRCFAGNASLLGCCDVIIATENSNIGMGGPAMIEGGGLGVFSPEEIGPMSVQVPNGVVDILVKDEADAVRTAKKYLSYFQGRTREWQAPDQRPMRRIVPENRLRAYNVRSVIDTLADIDSVLEVRQGYGIGSITCFIRIEGMPIGVIANNPSHLGGAIDSDGADKAARFMQLCDGFDIPLLYLCDTPGIMVGPEVEKTALVRHSSRMFIIGANLSVPYFTIILRKAYGLGAIAMAGGSHKSPMFSVAWPTGEFGGMGLEGSVKLGYRNELAAIEDPIERKARFDEMVAEAYERGKALNYASLFSIDDTIDPADSRRWVSSLLKSIRPAMRRQGKKRPAIDAW